uniref:Condensation domain-containing protein n=1 Tax=Globisporangium ultimum (strain ATCC 200006 / CBS 805.95 / DAOM BR144) TaxID=431595 RepID=K3W953_GLOUD
MAPQTFPLYGYERFFAMNPKTSAKLAHIMTVRGDIPALLTHLPTAVLATFNLHPRMRTALLPGHSPLKAMVCPTLVDLTELKSLYQVVERNDEYESSLWMRDVEAECEIPFNREQDLPFAIRIFVDKSSSNSPTFARIVLFADHYMSDTTSGTIILNSILQNATTTAAMKNATAGSGANAPTISTQELPLRASLYECMHWVNPWIGILNEVVSKWFIEPMFNFDHSGFTPFLPVDTSSQQDFCGQPPETSNKSSALFSQGNAENMQRALARCKAEGASFEGALIAASIMAFGLTKYNGRLRTASTTPVQLKMDVTCDMRDHLDHTNFSKDEHAVGMYSTAANLVFTSSKGVDVHSIRFWDLARKADHEVQCLVLNHELKLQSMYVHELLNAENTESTLKVQNCMINDTTISNCDAYPFPHSVVLGDGGSSKVEIETIHVYNSLPSLAPATMLFASAVTCFNYSMMYKVPQEVAKDLFHWYVQSVEHIGMYNEEDTLVEASETFTATSAVEVVPLASQ